MQQFLFEAKVIFNALNIKYEVARILTSLLIIPHN